MYDYHNLLKHTPYTFVLVHDGFVVQTRMPFRSRTASFSRCRSFVRRWTS